MEGYGLFWAITELLFTNNNMIQTDFAALAFQLHSKPEKIKSIINDFELFEVSEKIFKSKDVGQKIKEIRKKSKAAKENIMKRWNNKPSDTGVLEQNNEPITIKERKIKENKEKERGGEGGIPTPPPHSQLEDKGEGKIHIGSLPPPTKSQLRQFFFQNGYRQDSADRMYERMNWNVYPFKDNKGNDFFDWQKKAENVFFKEQDKIPVVGPTRGNGGLNR